MSLKSVAARLKKVTFEQNKKVLEQIVDESKDVVLFLNKQQLLEGMDAKGKSLGSYASESYAEMKKTLNPRGVVDLRLTGSFHDNFFLASEVPLVIWSYDEKTNSLVSKYGEDIFGLTPENKELYIRRYIKEKFNKYYRSLLEL